MGKRRVTQRSGPQRLHTRKRSPRCARSRRTLTQHCVDAAVNLLLECGQVGELGCAGAQVVNSRHDDDDERASRKIMQHKHESLGQNATLTVHSKFDDWPVSHLVVSLTVPLPRACHAMSSCPVPPSSMQIHYTAPLFVPSKF